MYKCNSSTNNDPKPRGESFSGKVQQDDFNVVWVNQTWVEAWSRRCSALALYSCIMHKINSGNIQSVYESFLAPILQVVDQFYWVWFQQSSILSEERTKWFRSWSPGGSCWGSSEQTDGGDVSSGLRDWSSSWICCFLWSLLLFLDLLDWTCETSSLCWPSFWEVAASCTLMDQSSFFHLIYSWSLQDMLLLE